MGKGKVSARRRAAEAARNSRKLARARRRLAKRQAWRAEQLAKFRKIMHEMVGPKIIATTRENPGPIRVRATKRPLVMRRVDLDGGGTEQEEYRALFAAFGHHTELEFSLDPDSDREIRRAAYEAAELAYGPEARGWAVIKVEGINDLGKEMLK